MLNGQEAGGNTEGVNEEEGVIFKIYAKTPVPIDWCMRRSICRNLVCNMHPLRNLKQFFKMQIKYLEELLIYKILYI